MIRSGLPDIAHASAEAKIRPPVYRPGLIPRVSLVDALTTIPDRASLISVTAPAGYGKTTVLSQWAAQDPRGFAWVTVDEADGDPVRLAGHVALAMHRIEPLQPEVFRALEAGGRSRHLVALSHLLGSLWSWPQPGVLVLDDVHELRSLEATNFIRALAAACRRASTSRSARGSRSAWAGCGARTAASSSARTIWPSPKGKHGHSSPRSV
jgi:LuxR family transcriptional regulator, maltose regulon positive regulatory protein